MPQAKERPLLVSPGLVRAYLAGRKTQTRRIIKPQPVEHDFGVGGVNVAFTKPQLVDGYEAVGVKTMVADNFAYMKESCLPYGRKGGKLWVREEWGVAPNFDDVPPRDLSSDLGVLYRATSKATGGRWRRSFHMPRWACRLILDVVGIRVQRLQDITPKDAIAEGVLHEQSPEKFRAAAAMVGGPYPRGIFAYLWDEINGAGAWERNDWVWVIETKPVVTFKGVQVVWRPDMGGGE